MKVTDDGIVTYTSRRSRRSDALIALALAVLFGAIFAVGGLVWHTHITIASVAMAYGVGWFSARRGLDLRR